MKNVLCFSESADDALNFIKGVNLLFFQIEQLEPERHNFSFFYEIYQKLKTDTDLSKIDLIIADYIESIPLVYFMRKDGFFCPVVFIPHTNPYPLNILFYFLLVSEFSHPKDCILCGSVQAAKGYQHIVNIPALPICTFGIKSFYKKGDKIFARKMLGLPLDKKILLYTGRFMNDKGLASLLQVYEKLKKRKDDVILVLSITHIDPAYFNSLASQMRDVIMFYRLEKEETALLYQSADLFVSAATSVFETYGKSPLEAIASGVPVVLPRWDGFSYFINEHNGSLAKIIYSGPIEDAPYSFASVDVEDFVYQCVSWLDREKIIANSELPDWAYYDKTMNTLTLLIQDLLSNSQKFEKKGQCDLPLTLSKYPAIVQKICAHYSLNTCEDLELKTEKLGLINREDPGDLDLLRELHDELFKTMDATSGHILEEKLLNYPITV